MHKLFNFGLCILIILVISLSASAQVQIGYESATVGRIVGDSPSEMINQLKNDDIHLKEATYYSNVNARPGGWDSHSEKVEDVLDNSFNGDQKTVRDTVFDGWAWTDVMDDVKDFNKNNLLILESSGTFENNLIRAESPDWGDDDLHPDNAYMIKYSDYNPLLIFNSDYAGLFLPKLKSFVGKLGDDKIIIAPSAIPDEEFMKILVCNLGRYGELGKTFRNARNNYYWQTNRPSGLSLMSWQLFGNPAADISIPNNNPSSNWCDDVVKDYDLMETEATTYRIYKSGEFSSQGIITDLYTYEASEIMNSYSIEESDGYKFIHIPGFLQSDDEDYPVLPRKVNQLELPLGTIVTNLSVLYKGNPVDINENDIPSWEVEFIDRLCKENSYDASVKYSHSFTEDYEVVLVELNPVEVVDCAAGQFRLYKNITYKIDYLPDSSVLFDYVHYPDNVLPEMNTGITLSLKRVKTVPVDGTIRVLHKGIIVSEKSIYFDLDSFETSIAFIAPNEEGLFNYVVEFVEGGRVTSRTSFDLKVAMVDAYLNIPNIVGSSTNIELELYNHYSDPLSVIVYHELMKDSTTLTSGSSSYTLNPGWNLVNLPFSGLSKSDRSYSLKTQVIYSNYKKVLSGLIVTNRMPVVDGVIDISVKEGEIVEINPYVYDADNDEITTVISSPVGNDGLWIPTYSDSGNYTITIDASDGYLAASTTMNVEVLDMPPDNLSVIFRDCNFGLYRGGLAEIALYNPSQDSLESWFMNGQYDELNIHSAVTAPGGWPMGTCEKGTDYLCIEDSNITDPRWGVDDNFPDPVFEKGGECTTDKAPIYWYKNHEICQGNIPCMYPVCMASSDCGAPHWVGEKYCTVNDVYLNLRNYSCSNPGNYNASCAHTDVPILLENCNSEEECHLGNCVPIICFNDTQCGVQYDVGKYCTGLGVYNKHREFECTNPGTALSECNVIDTEEFIETCDAVDQNCMYGQCINKSHYIVGEFEDGKQIANLTFYEGGEQTAYILIPKDIDIISTHLKVRGGNS